MAIIRRSENPGAGMTPTRGWDPFEIMQDVMRWEPLRELYRAGAEAGFLPTFDVKETKDAYVFKADLPGVRNEDMDISLTGNRLTISGERNEEKEEKGETYYSCERKYGSFSRSYTLPEGADGEHIHAELNAGVLTVGVPKLPAIQAKKITVKSGAVKT